MVVGTLKLPRGISGLRIAVTPEITQRFGSGKGVLKNVCEDKGERETRL